MNKQTILQVLKDNSIEEKGNFIFDPGNLEVAAMELSDKINNKQHKEDCSRV